LRHGKFAAAHSREADVSEIDEAPGL